MLAAVVDTVVVCAKLSALVATAALVGPVPLEDTSIASELVEIEQPAGGVIIIV
jgi:hypothetical protein